MTEKTPFSFDFNASGFEQDPGFRVGTLDEDRRPWDDADVLFPGAEPRNQYEPLDPEKVPQVDAVRQDTPEYASRPAEERTRELFAYMRPHRMALLGILTAASEPTSSAKMDEVVEAQHQHKFNVYTAANLCTMLETAGALDRVVEDGTPYSEFEPKPDIVIIDGEEYYQPTEPPAVHWLVSEAGQIMVDENDPLARMQEVMNRDADLLGIYKQVLLLAQDGASMATFSENVDANPQIAEPRRFFVQHFVEGLERCEAVEWNGECWVITETGRTILEDMFAEIKAADAFVPDERSTPTSGNTVPTETAGLNW